MPERILEFKNAVVDSRGRAYSAHVEAAQRLDGRWEGAVVFTPHEQGEPLATPHETVQGDVADIHYWAASLTPEYLEGALERAQEARRLLRGGIWQNDRGTEIRRTRFRVECDEDRVCADLLGTFAFRPGVTRDLPDGSRIRYTGSSQAGADGSRREHTFELLYRERRGPAEEWVQERLGASARNVEFEEDDWQP